MRSFAIMLVLLCSMTCTAGAVHLSWDPDTGADHYVVYYGNESGNYAHNTEPVYGFEAAVDVDLSKTWFFSVKAFDACGNSSDYSDEVVYSELPEVITGLAAYGNTEAGAIRVTVERLDEHGVWVPVVLTVNEPSLAPIMGNEASKIYHVRMCRYYKSATVPFEREDDARTAGYRACVLCGSGSGGEIEP